MFIIPFVFLSWEILQFYIVVYPNIKKSGLFRTFNGAKQHSSSNTDNILTILYLVGLQSHTKSHESNKTLFTLIGSYVHNSEYSIIMSFNDKKNNIWGILSVQNVVFDGPIEFCNLRARKNWSNIDFSICTMIVPVWRKIPASKSVWPERMFNFLKQ